MDTKNVVALVGRLVADPELRYLDNGTPVANFAVAVNRSNRKADGSFEDSLDGFFDCELFGGQALTLSETCSKGSEIQVMGSLLQKKFKTKGAQPRTVSKVEIRVRSVAQVLAAAKTSSAPAPSEAEPQPA